MAIPEGLNDREHRKFVESVATPGKPAVAIVNPDGTNIGGSGGTSMTDNTAFVQGASSLTPAGYLGDDAADPLGANERIGAARMNRTTRVQYAELVDQAGNPLSDDANDALRVNVVAGGAGGGTAQLAVRNSGDTAWDNVGPSSGRSKVPAVLYKTDGTILIGQKTMADSIPVVVASDQSNLPLAARARTTDSISAADVTDRIMDNLTALTPKFARINGSTNGDNTLVSAVASKKIRVLALSIVAAGAVTVNFQTAAAGAMLAGPYTLAANGGVVLPYSPVGHFETVAGDLLNMELNAAVVVGGHLVYVEV